MKKFLKYIKENIVFYIILILVIIAFNVKLPYSIYSPGGLIDVRERLSGDDMYEQKGSLNLTYVTSRYGTISNLLIALINPSWDIEKNEEVINDNETLEEISIRNVLALKQSVCSATNIAYLAAGKSITVKSESDYVSYILDEADTDLKIGDEILKIDNKSVSEIKDFKEYIQSKKAGDKVNILVSRDDKEVKTTAVIKEIDDTLLIGVQITRLYDFDLDPKITYEVKKNEEGPSGGLMLTLSIYNALVEEDITNGMVISGTGTIESDGSVGEISGVKYKLAGAVKNGAEVFIAPSENYEEAVKLKEKNNYDIKIIEAKNFNQVLEELKNLKE